jgi:hypothetical protein
VVVPGCVLPGCVVPGLVCPGVVWPDVDCPDIDPEVCPAVDPAVPAPADPAEPLVPLVCNAAIITGAALVGSFSAVGPGAGEGAALPLAHWSATLVALVTLNSFAAPADALEFMPEFAPEAVPELAAAEAPEPEAFALEPMLPDPSCPVTCTSFPISVRTAFKFPVSL